MSGQLAILPHARPFEFISPRIPVLTHPSSCDKDVLLLWPIYHSSSPMLYVVTTHTQSVCFISPFYKAHVLLCINMWYFSAGGAWCFDSNANLEDY